MQSLARHFYEIKPYSFPKWNYSMRLSDIVPRIQTKLDDPDGSYLDQDYVSAHAQDVYEAVYNEIYNTGSQSVEKPVELLNVAASTADLSAYQLTGQSLAMMVNPRLVEYKLAGQDRSFYRYADGPLDKVRDIPAPGLPTLDSWGWIQRNLTLSLFNVVLDLRVTGAFLFDPLLSADVTLEAGINANALLVSRIALSIAIARGNPGWITAYTAESQDRMDNLLISLTKAEQAKTRRVGRINRRSSTAGNSINIHS
jgi:hypothetical protein